jgi:hypothetical protein
MTPGTALELAALSASTAAAYRARLHRLATLAAAADLTAPGPAQSAAYADLAHAATTRRAA